MKRFGIITSGGDCPGLNAVIYSIFQSLKVYDAELIGIYQHALGSQTSFTTQKLEEIDPFLVSRSGTFLGSMVDVDIQPFEPMRLANFEKHLFAALSPLQLKGLFLLGGDSSIGYVSKMLKDHLPIIAIPKTIDNDVSYTDTALGFKSAIETVVDLLENLKQTGASHKRIMVAEVMGRDTGFIALEAGIAAFADAIVIPEKPLNHQDFKDFLLKRYAESQRGVLVVVSEGAPSIKEFMQQDIPLPSRYTRLGHLQRGGRVSAMDRFMAAHLGAYAVDLAFQNLWNKVVVFENQQPIHKDLSEISSTKRFVTNLKIDICRKLGIFI